MFSKSGALLCAGVAGMAPLVAAHGYVTQIKSGGQLINTWLPFVDPYQQPVPSKPTRKFKDDGPVTDVSSKAIACNGGGPVSTVAKGFKAGDKVTFYWTKWPEDHRGPVMTYLANCKGDCTKFDGTKGWFKIDEAGLKEGKWATDQLIADNSSWTVTIPSSIAAGQYLLRHEILALHSASAPNGAQFYPSCNQISITSSGSAKPAGVSFPGAYSAKDPGILVDIWSGISSYKIPGPPVFAASSSSSSSSGASSGASPGSSTPSATVTSSTSTSTQASGSANNGDGDEHCPAHHKSHKKGGKKKSHHKGHKKPSKGHKKKTKAVHHGKSRVVKTHHKANHSHKHHHAHDGHRRHHHQSRDTTSFLVRS